jgi:DNA-binding CsgD family transcriptional regulator
VTTRQLEVIALVAQGLATKEIASRLGVSEAAVKKHLAHLMARYGVPNRAALVRAGIANGILFASQDQDRSPSRSRTDLVAAIVIEAAGAPGPEPGEVVALPWGVATYTRNRERQRMVVRRDGARIEVQGSLDLTRDELAKIAGSLVALPRRLL